MAHLKECEYDWNYEEMDKPKHERIPLPKAPSDFSKLFEAAKRLLENPVEVSENNSASHSKSLESSGEGESEEEESEEESDHNEEKEDSPKDIEHPETLHTETDNAEISLIPCPNCKRTFFPDRLGAHLKI